MPLEASTVWPLDFQPGNPGRKPPTFRLGARPPGQRKGRQRRGGIGREAQVSAGATVVPAPDDPQTEPAPPSRAQGRGWETRYCLAHLPPPRVQVRPVPDNPSEAGSLALGTATRAAGGGDRGACVRLLRLRHRDCGPGDDGGAAPATEAESRGEPVVGGWGGVSHIHTPRSSLSQLLICKPQSEKAMAPHSSTLA